MSRYIQQLDEYIRANNDGSMENVIRAKLRGRSTGEILPNYRPDNWNSEMERYFANWQKNRLFRSNQLLQTSRYMSVEFELDEQTADLLSLGEIQGEESSVDSEQYIFFNSSAIDDASNGNSNKTSPTGMRRRYANLEELYALGTSQLISEEDLRLPDRRRELRSPTKLQIEISSETNPSYNRSSPVAKKGKNNVDLKENAGHAGYKQKYLSDVGNSRDADRTNSTKSTSELLHEVERLLQARFPTMCMAAAPEISIDSAGDALSHRAPRGGEQPSSLQQEKYVSGSNAKKANQFNSPLTAHRTHYDHDTLMGLDLLTISDDEDQTVGGGGGIGDSISIDESSFSGYQVRPWRLVPQKYVSPAAERRRQSPRSVPLSSSVMFGSPPGANSNMHSRDTKIYGKEFWPQTPTIAPPADL